jgi:hypothetical protein
MTNHTTGPWTENACEVQAPDGSPICEMLARPEDADKWGRHHADANSRLICAAPDLLAALESLTEAASKQLPQGSDHDGLTNCDLLAKARAAIAKADTQDETPTPGGAK